MNIVILKSLYFFASQKMRVVHVLQCECGGQKIPAGNWYPPPPMWVSGTKLRTPGNSSTCRVFSPALSILKGDYRAEEWLLPHDLLLRLISGCRVNTMSRLCTHSTPGQTLPPHPGEACTQQTKYEHMCFLFWVESWPSSGYVWTQQDLVSGIRSRKK